MIMRIVKMTFQEGKTAEFISLFNTAKNKIASFNGCEGVELMRDVNYQEVFFTFSKWQNTDALENYRQSALFKETWAKTKKLFSAKAEAWSAEIINR